MFVTLYFLYEIISNLFKQQAHEQINLNNNFFLPYLRSISGDLTNNFDAASATSENQLDCFSAGTFYLSVFLGKVLQALMGGSCERFLIYEEIEFLYSAKVAVVPYADNREPVRWADMRYNLIIHVRYVWGSQLVMPCLCESCKLISLAEACPARAYVVICFFNCRITQTSNLC